jgi:hypothetical protein
MRRGTVSRNRSFDAFEGTGSVGARARRVFRHLRSLERDLARHAGRAGAGVRLHVERGAGGGRRITIEVPEVRMRRTAIVSAEEYELLREHPEARALLEAVECGATEDDLDLPPAT